jgi:hypothetical protein
MDSFALGNYNLSGPAGQGCEWRFDFMVFRNFLYSVGVMPAPNDDISLFFEILSNVLKDNELSYCYSVNVKNSLMYPSARI